MMKYFYFFSMLFFYYLKSAEVPNLYTILQKNTDYEYIFKNKENEDKLHKLLEEIEEESKLSSDIHVEIDYYQKMLKYKTELYNAKFSTSCNGGNITPIIVLCSLPLIRLTQLYNFPFSRYDTVLWPSWGIFFLAALLDYYLKKESQEDIRKKEELKKEIVLLEKEIQPKIKDLEENNKLIYSKKLEKDKLQQEIINLEREKVKNEQLHIFFQELILKTLKYPNTVFYKSFNTIQSYLDAKKNSDLVFYNTLKEIFSEYSSIVKIINTDFNFREFHYELLGTENFKKLYPFVDPYGYDFLIETVFDIMLDKKKEKRFLFHGAPGTGKTNVVYKLISDFVKKKKDNVYFFKISLSDITEPIHFKILKDQIRELLKKAENNVVVFIDEIEAMIPKREGDISASDNKIVNEFLQFINDLQQEERFLFFSCTNHENKIDSAVKGGRRLVSYELNLPAYATRKTIFLNVFEELLKEKELELDALFADIIQENIEEQFEKGKALTKEEFFGFLAQISAGWSADIIVKYIKNKLFFLPEGQSALSYEILVQNLIKHLKETAGISLNNDDQYIQRIKELCKGKKGENVDLLLNGIQKADDLGNVHFPIKINLTEMGIAAYDDTEYKTLLDVLMGLQKFMGGYNELFASFSAAFQNTATAFSDTAQKVSANDELQRETSKSLQKAIEEMQKLSQKILESGVEETVSIANEATREMKESFKALITQCEALSQELLKVTKKTNEEQVAIVKTVINNYDLKVERHLNAVKDQVKLVEQQGGEYQQLYSPTLKTCKEILQQCKQEKEIVQRFFNGKI